MKPLQWPCHIHYHHSFRSVIRTGPFLLSEDAIREGPACVVKENNNLDLKQNVILYSRRLVNIVKMIHVLYEMGGQMKYTKSLAWLRKVLVDCFIPVTGAPL